MFAIFAIFRLEIAFGIVVIAYRKQTDIIGSGKSINQTILHKLPEALLWSIAFPARKSNNLDE